MHVALNLRSGDPFTQNSNVLSSPGTYEEEHPAMTFLFNLQNIEYYFKWGRDEWVAGGGGGGGGWDEWVPALPPPPPTSPPLKVH